MQVLVYVAILTTIYNGCSALWCYQCTAATPGCTEPFNWRGVGYMGNPCPDAEDVCVKLIERKGAKEVITRDCLSNFKGFRTDIPADTYEGCRTAAKDVNLANFVNNTIKELDIKSYYKTSKRPVAMASYHLYHQTIRHSATGPYRNWFCGWVDWYDETIWCFCFLDHRCNSGSINSYSIVILALTSIILLTKKIFIF